MRLINTTTLAPEEFIGSRIPAYAILSHTWEEDEATYAHWMSASGLEGPGEGKVKIRSACNLAKRQGYRYIWVDTCCIDKSSSAELTEAINSMFQWYQRAVVCYVYLSDLGPNDPNDEMGRCRWFTRGWTLQELLAPEHVHFYDMRWEYRGTKIELYGLISQIANIHMSALLHVRDLDTFPVARRMAWAALRTTTREEDMAYCLLGIFNVNMPLIYGEGSKAFVRLQEEIIKQNNDLSIFCWKSSDQPMNNPQFRGVLAESPREFQHFYIPDHVPLTGKTAPEFTATNKGIRIRVPVSQDLSGLWFMCLSSGEGKAVGIWLKRYGDGLLYARSKPHEIEVRDHCLWHSLSAERYLTKLITSPALLAHVTRSKPNQFKFV